MSVTSASHTMPAKIGRYQIERELGRGGMGVVHLARDPFIGRYVAIKSTLTPPPTDPDKLRDYQFRFFNEAHAAGKLSHPNIVYLYDASMESNLNYLVLEYVDGYTLREYCYEERLLPVQTVVNIVYQCAKALDYAHKREVIHRDIKPSNIMISSTGQAKVTDFGIAAVEGPSHWGMKGLMAASMYYSSPEQLRQRILNHQTDIYSLGVVMFELLTGSRPFVADSDVGLFFKITSEDAPRVRSIRPDLPESLDRIVAKAMNRDLSERYKTGQQMAWELSAYFDYLRHLDDNITMEERFHAIKKIEFFKDFTAKELSEVVDVTQWVTFPDKAQIIKEGTIEDCFYIIVSGQVMVQKRGRPIGVLSAGDCFGEMAYMGKTTRTASVEAVGETELMRVNPTVIDQTSKDTQLRFYRVFATTLVQRLIETSDLLARSGS